MKIVEDRLLRLDGPDYGEPFRPMVSNLDPGVSTSFIK